jgi:hypothetical protein
MLATSKSRGVWKDAIVAILLGFAIEAGAIGVNIYCVNTYNDRLLDLGIEPCGAPEWLQYPGLPLMERAVRSQASRRFVKRNPKLVPVIRYAYSGVGVTIQIFLFSTLIFVFMQSLNRSRFARLGSG